MNAFMKKGVLLGLTVLLLSAACNKDKFESKPSLKLKDMNGNVIPIKATWVVRFDYTDKEGDIDDTLFMIRQRLNIRGSITMPALKFPVPTFPHQTKGEIKADLDYDRHLTVGLNPVGNSPNFETDTMMYKFVLKDKANNTSDTAVVGPIYVQRTP